MLLFSITNTNKEKEMVMTIHKINKNKISCLEMCEVIKALGSVSVHSDDVFGDRYRTALMSITNALVNHIESCYIPEKKKYKVEVLPNICERIEVEALDEHEAKDIACGIVDKKYPDHDGKRVYACKEVK